MGEVAIGVRVGGVASPERQVHPTLCNAPPLIDTVFIHSTLELK